MEKPELLVAKIELRFDFQAEGKSRTEIVNSLLPAAYDRLSKMNLGRYLLTHHSVDPDDNNAHVLTFVIGTDVHDAVKEALSNAAENGNTFEGKTDEFVAQDMCTYDSTLERIDLLTVRRVVADVRRSK